MKIDSPNASGIISGFGVPTGGTSGQVLQKTSNTNYGTQWVTPSTSTRYAYWTPWVSLDPSGMGATYVAPNAENQGENGIKLTNTLSDGQSAFINWTSTDIDWTKDFKVTAVLYNSVYGTLSGNTGDGFVIYAGSTAVAGTYANAADGGLKFRIFTYGGASDPHQPGVSFWTNTTKGPQGRTGNDWTTGIWLRYTVEVCRDKVTNKRNAVAYVDVDGALGDYGNRRAIAAMDVTSWTPGGTNFGISCSTGSARSEQYVHTLQFEAL